MQFRNLPIQGKKTALSEELEEKLADMVKRMEKMGMGPTLLEFRELVREYLLANKIDTIFSGDLPGYDWSVAFMKRHHLTLKKGGMMQLARKSVTSDPFVIYGFYNLLKCEMDRLQISDRPECLWNLDETCFPLDPSKPKTIGSIGSKTVRLTCGSNRENITVLGICSADGSAMDPIIVFKGKNMQTSWVGSNALPDTQYAVTDSGWMTRPVFEDIFKSFVERTKDTRPLLLIYDGHLSHTSLATIELAMEENITIIKLPAHCTDLLQPLDVACFAPLKSYYDSKLLEHVHQTGARDPLRRNGFVNMLSGIWRKGLSEENVKSGFRATGIFPFNPDKYKKDRLDPLKLITYTNWTNAGCPVDADNMPQLTSNNDTVDDQTPDVETEVVSENVENEVISKDARNEEVLAVTQNETILQPIAVKETRLSFQSVSDRIPVKKCKTSTSAENTQINQATLNQREASPGSPAPVPGCSHWQEPPNDVHKLSESTKIDIKKNEASYAREISWRGLINEIQARAPEGTKYNILLTTKETETTLEEILHSRGRSGPTPPKPRRKINTHAEIITQKQCIEQMNKNVVQKKKLSQKKEKQPRKKVKRTKQPESDLDSTTSVEDEVDFGHSSDDLSLDLDEDPADEDAEQMKPTKPPESKHQKPKISEESIGKYYAVYYTEPLTYYWGKVTKVFSEDEEGEVTRVELDFLRKKTITSNPKGWSWIERVFKDLEIVPTDYVFYGPEKPNFEKSTLYFPDETVYTCLQNTLMHKM